jgi:hypothetical protein
MPVTASTLVHKAPARDAAYRLLIPPDLAANQRPLSESGRAELELALRRYYFSQPGNYLAATRDEYLASPDGRSFGT